MPPGRTRSTTTVADPLDVPQLAGFHAVRALLESLLGEARPPYLHVVTAYRDNEVDAGHPFRLAVEILRQAGTFVDELVLAPLEAADTTAMIAGTLHRSADDVAPLAELLHQRTGGNPFFLIQLLHALHDAQLVKLDPALRAWHWKLDDVVGHGVTGTIVEVMAARLDRLPDGCKDVLRAAACIGNTPVQFVQSHVTFVREAAGDLLRIADAAHALREALPAGTPRLAELAALEDAADLEYLALRMPEALDQAMYGLDRVATLVRSMKEFAHADQREKTASDINRALTATLTIAHNEYTYVADTQVELGIVPPVVCHISELNQCFLNLIVNAAHAIADVTAATGKRGVIGVRTRVEDGLLVIEISDTGGGIPRTRSSIRSSPPRSSAAAPARASRSRAT